MPFVHEIFIGIKNNIGLNLGLILMPLGYQYCVSLYRAYRPLQGNDWRINKPTSGPAEP